MGQCWDLSGFCSFWYWRLEYLQVGNRIVTSHCWFTMCWTIGSGCNGSTRGIWDQESMVNFLHLLCVRPLPSFSIQVGLLNYFFWFFSHVESLGHFWDGCVNLQWWGFLLDKLTPESCSYKQIFETVSLYGKSTNSTELKNVCLILFLKKSFLLCWLQCLVQLFQSQSSALNSRCLLLHSGRLFDLVRMMMS